MKQYITLLIDFLKGRAAKFGTTKNFLREVVVGTLTATGTYLIIQLLSFWFKPPDPVTDLKDVLLKVTTNQHLADSAHFALKMVALQRKNDSLNNILIKKYEADSIRSHAGLSDLDAMRAINRAIRKR